MALSALLFWWTHSPTAPDSPSAALGKAVLCRLTVRRSSRGGSCRVLQAMWWLLVHWPQARCPEKPPSYPDRFPSWNKCLSVFLVEEIIFLAVRRLHLCRQSEGTYGGKMKIKIPINSLVFSQEKVYILSILFSVSFVFEIIEQPRSWSVCVFYREIPTDNTKGVFHLWWHFSSHLTYLLGDFGGLCCFIARRVDASLVEFIQLVNALHYDIGWFDFHLFVHSYFSLFQPLKNSVFINPLELYCPRTNNWSFYFCQNCFFLKGQLNCASLLCFSRLLQSHKCLLYLIWSLAHWLTLKNPCNVHDIWHPEKVCSKALKIIKYENTI